VYTTRQVAQLLDLPPHQVRAYARAGFLAPTRNERGWYRFAFQDLVLLRAAMGLVVPLSHQRVRRVLASLRGQVQRERSLSEIRIAVVGHQLMAQDGEAVWNPESGQMHLNFASERRKSRVARLPERSDADRHAGEAEEWFERGVALEERDPVAARVAYQQAIALMPHHAAARVNFGRLLHDDGKPQDAIEQYVQALNAEPAHAVAHFNLGVAREDTGDRGGALAAYRRAVRYNPRFADAHFNLASLYERLGNPQAALRHLTEYRALTP
jgi:tetratricopeptide (TPR) repeat protein